MRTIAALLLMGACVLSHAETPSQIEQAYVAEAAARQPGFTPNAGRGKDFFHQHFGINDKMPACTTCHTDNPLAPGQHAVTGKAIRPLAVAANGERFTDPTKVEKWFGRNCKEVVGRPCSAAEKADFIAYMNGKL
ncbi:MAG: DUF1924 domain-containing protein [Betaproteobacteria bacterium]|nr:DUF1924 domain-containing protein [Betaproteobacteria bacterium]